MGDAGLSADTMALNFDTPAFHMNYAQVCVRAARGVGGLRRACRTKWTPSAAMDRSPMWCVCARQRRGCVEVGGRGHRTAQVPYMRYGGRPADPSWSAAFPQILWAQSHYNNNLAPAQAYWPWLLDYLNNMAQQARAAGGGRRRRAHGGACAGGEQGRHREPGGPVR